MRSITTLLGIVVVLLLANSNANACSCAVPRSPCQVYGWAGAVFVGTVVGVADQRSKSNDPNVVAWAPAITLGAAEKLSDLEIQLPPKQTP